MTAAGRTRSWLAGLIGHGVGPVADAGAARARGRSGRGFATSTRSSTSPTSTVDRAGSSGCWPARSSSASTGSTSLTRSSRRWCRSSTSSTPRSTSIGALNTVLIRDGRTIGHNTDVTGFRRSFDRRTPRCRPRPVVLLGAGGAGTAVAHALVQTSGCGGCSSSTRTTACGSAGRDRSAGSPIKVELVPAPGRARGRRSATAPDWSTPARWGWRPTPARRCRRSCCDRDLWLADIVYRPIDTPLLRAARETGCPVLNGAGMAVHQAADAFELITGRPADRDGDAARLRRPRGGRGRCRLVDGPASGTLKKGTAMMAVKAGRRRRSAALAARPRAPDDARRVRRATRRAVAVARRPAATSRSSSPTATPRPSRSTAAAPR